MYNVWNTNGNCGCQGNCGGALGSLFNSGYQFVCRDCCGNIRVNNNPCGCSYQRRCRHTCGCCSCNSCGSSNNDTNSTTGNATGNYGCVTVCGTTTGSSSTANNAYYNARYGTSRSCGCGGYYNS